MCGFVVVLKYNGGGVDTSTLSIMSNALVHRGPDDAGIHTDGPVGLGFRRLAILDLTEAGHQPMVAADGSAVLAFNGELFNYVELRAELQSLGHTFRSSGDAEVLLRSYLEWGASCVDRFNGEWAFVIYDKIRKRLFGSRDRFGIKPLFRLKTNEEIVWASEIKALLKLPGYRPETNWSVAADYFSGGRIDHTGESFFKGIDSVPAATAFEVSIDGDETRRRFWSIPEGSLAEAPRDPAEEFAALFDDSVALRLRSDVPVAVCLSGGLDSTSILCAMSRARRSAEPVQAFSYHHDEYDERPYIDATLARTSASLRRLEMDQRSLWDMTGQVLACQDEPVHSLTAMVGYRLMQMISGAGIRVVLNGQGADEAFAGYARYFRSAWYGTLRRGDVLGAWHGIRAFAAAHGGSARQLFIDALVHTVKSQLRLLGPYRELGRRRMRARLTDHPWFAGDVLARGTFAYPASATLRDVLERSVTQDPLPNYLRIEDRNSMAHSVEVRLPWLDYRLLEYAFPLADDWKIRGPLNKYIVRESMRDRIPDVVQQRVDKMGFPVGMPDLLRGKSREAVLDILGSRKARERGIYDTRRILDDIDGRREGEDAALAYDAFRIAQFELWSNLYGV